MINIKMQPSGARNLSPKIAVIGVGGAGGNAVNNMISAGLEGCEFIVCNSDAQALANSLCQTRVQLGVNATGGLGAGSKPEVGRAAAEESLDEVMKLLDGANMAFVTAGMGGGTGTGAAPVIAKACRERGILTVGVVTKPFHFEGAHRMRSAESGLEEMQHYVDTLIVIPNQNLFRIANEKTTFAEAFKMADSVLQSGVRGVTDLMVRPGLVNLDFADVRTAMLEMGKAMMGTGEAVGDKRAIEAAEAAINNPLLDDVSMKGARGVIINVTGGYDMTLFEADEACNRIRDEVDPDANIIFGATFDESMEGIMRVSIVATGIEKDAVYKTRSGGSSLNTDGGSKASLERAQPNTKPAARAEYEPAPAQVPSFISATAARANIPSAPQTLPTFLSTEAPAASSIKAEPELEMLEQQKYVSVGNESAALAQNTALRGTIYKDSFIPPKPAEAGASSALATAATGFHGAPAYNPVPAKAESRMNLNPPKLPEAKPQAKKTPSLFERITGSVQQAVEGIKDEVQPSRGIRPQQRIAPTASTSSAAPAYAAPEVPPTPAQGSLNIDSPAKPKRPEDELDIPAFLRRQAN